MKKYSTLEELYNNMNKLIYTYIGDFTKDTVIAQDISSIIWGKVAQNPFRFLDMEINHLRNYMRKMVKTAVSDYFKIENQQNEIVKLKDLLKTEKSVEEEYVRREDLFYLAEAMKVLDKDELVLIYLRVEAKLGAREVGETFGISEGAVRVKQYRILKKLRDEIIRCKNR